jgi:hypothetical protein
MLVSSPAPCSRHPANRPALSQQSCIDSPGCSAIDRVSIYRASGNSSDSVSKSENPKFDRAGLGIAKLLRRRELRISSRRALLRGGFFTGTRSHPEWITAVSARAPGKRTKRHGKMSSARSATGSECQDLTPAMRLVGNSTATDRPTARDSGRRLHVGRLPDPLRSIDCLVPDDCVRRENAGRIQEPPAEALLHRRISCGRCTPLGGSSISV